MVDMKPICYPPGTSRAGLRNVTHLSTPRISSQTNAKTRKMIGYIFALLPLYILVYLPLSQMWNGPQQKSTRQQILRFNESFIAADEPLSCPPHGFSTHILSHEPLIIYIEDFLSEKESEHLLKIRYLLAEFWFYQTISSDIPFHHVTDAFAVRTSSSLQPYPQARRLQSVKTFASQK
jgi:prolyl 4-hydroxylase